MTTTVASPPLDRRVQLLAYCWTVNTLAYSIVYPFLPIYLHKLRGFPMGMVGLIFPIMGVARIVAPLCAGPWIDRVGRRLGLWLGPGARSISFLAMAVCAVLDAPLPVFMVGLFVNAFFGALFQTSSDAYITDITTPAQRSTAYSRIRVGLNIGWMTGPVIGAFLARTPFSLLFAVTGVLCLTTSVLAYRSCPESLRREATPAPRESAWQEIRQDGVVVRHLAASFLLFLLTSQLVSTFAIVAVDVPGVNQNGLGFLYAVNGLIVILCQLPLERYCGGGRLGGRLLLGALLYTAGYFSIAFGFNWWCLMASVLVLSAGEILAQPALTTVMSRMSAPHRVGAYMGAFGLVSGVAASIGPFFGALAYEHLRAFPILLWGLLSSTALLAFLAFLTLRRATVMR